MLVVFLIFAVLAFAASASDALTYRVPNAIPLALLFVFIALAYAYGGDKWQGHLLAGTGTALLALTLFVCRALGTSDAKLLAALAVWAGPDGLFLLLFSIALAALFVTVVLTVARDVLPLLRNKGLIKLPQQLPRALRQREPIPYGVGIGLGAVIASPWFPDWLWQI
ncbi:MAG: A24 family peptidase [Alphaproteobacteria bacterium]